MAYPFRAGFSPAGLLTPFHAKLRLTIPGDQAFLAHQDLTLAACEEQRQVLLEQGCDLAQGFLFGHPAPAAAFAERWLAPTREQAA